MEPIELIIIAAAVYFVYRLLLLNAKRKLLSYRIQTAMQAIEERTLECTVEQHGKALYLWEKETDKFMAQGNTIEELFENAKKYFPDTVLLIEEDTIKEFLGKSELLQLQSIKR
jgi:hypothetical protein